MVDSINYIHDGVYHKCEKRTLYHYIPRIPKTFPIGRASFISHISFSRKLMNFLHKTITFQHIIINYSHIIIEK